MSNSLKRPFPKLLTGANKKAHIGDEPDDDEYVCKIFVVLIDL